MNLSVRSPQEDAVPSRGLANDEFEVLTTKLDAAPVLPCCELRSATLCRALSAKVEASGCVVRVTRRQKTRNCMINSSV